MFSGVLSPNIAMCVLIKETICGIEVNRGKVLTGELRISKRTPKGRNRKSYCYIPGLLNDIQSFTSWYRETIRIEQTKLLKQQSMFRTTGIALNDLQTTNWSYHWLKVQGDFLQPPNAQTTLLWYEIDRSGTSDEIEQNKYENYCRLRLIQTVVYVLKLRM